MSEAESPSGSQEDVTPAFAASIPADTLQTTLALVDALVDECHLYADDDGIRIPAIDPATVASAELALAPDAFDSYDAEPTHVGLDLERFRDVVGLADSDQSIHLALDAETAILHVSVGELEYGLALLDPDTVRSPPDQSTAEFGFTGEVVTTPDVLHRGVRAADMVSDHLALGIDDDERAFYVTADGDTDDVSLAVPEADLEDLDSDDAHSLFSIAYLQSIDRAIPGDAELALQLGTEAPLSIQFEYADGAGSVEYLVAPRRTAY